jgi:fluoroquinolone transport system permease protein
MLVLFVLLLGQLPRRDLAWIVPAVMVNNLIVNGFYFVAGIVLLEKGEGSLQAQVVTPLRPAEYLGAKVASLTLLSLAENGLLAFLTLGRDVSPGWLFLGILAGTCFFTLSGFLVVVRYESINEYLLPSVVIVSALALPLFTYFGLGNSDLLATLLYLHPLQAVLLALRAATGVALRGWQIGYALLYPVVVTYVILHLAQATYVQFVRRSVSGGNRSHR